MDIFAHFLWTFAIYWRHPRRWLAGFIGMLPDLLSFGVFTVITFLHGGFHPGAPNISSIPAYVFLLYSITHSLVTFTVVSLILWFTARDWFWLMGGWLLHILIDIPTHSGTFFPTPFLWPISDFRVSGVSWATPWFMFVNYGLLVCLYTWLIYTSRKSTQGKTA